MRKVDRTDLDTQGEAVPSSLDEIAREGARRMLVVALEAEVGEHYRALRA